MEFQNQPKNAAQVTVFLYHCLYVLMYLHTYRRPEAEQKHLVYRAAHVLGADKIQTQQMQETLLSKEIPEITQLQDSTEYRDMQKYLPQRYQTIPVVLWLILKNRRHRYPDLYAACRAADKSISLRIRELQWRCWKLYCPYH